MIYFHRTIISAIMQNIHYMFDDIVKRLAFY